MDSKPDEMRSEVAEGLRYTHNRANSNTAKLLEVSSFAYAAIELLAEKGLIEIEVLDRKKKDVADRLQQEGIGAAYQDPELDKYTFESSVEIDCESRLHLCKAVCCRLRFALSHEDVDEGIVQWDFAHPYFIAHREDGYCSHLDREHINCTIHQSRPVPCRAYDCRNDKRIWSDFERHIVSPELDKLFATTQGNNGTEESRT